MGHKSYSYNTMQPPAKSRGRTTDLSKVGIKGATGMEKEELLLIASAAIRRYGSGGLRQKNLSKRRFERMEFYAETSPP